MDMGFLLKCSLVFFFILSGVLVHFVFNGTFLEIFSIFYYGIAGFGKLPYFDKIWCFFDIGSR